MLHEFVALNRDAIVARTRDHVRERPWPSVSNQEVEEGVPLFLTQLTETLRAKVMHSEYPDDLIGSAAARHGAEALAAGLNVSQVVHDYGDICQAITEIAAEQQAPISVEEFHTLNRCLDTAIAEAVTEHVRLTSEKRSTEEAERLGRSVHDFRDLLNGAILAFHTLKRGTVAINGSTGAVLGRSLTKLRDLVDRTLSEVRLASGIQQRERLNVAALLDDIASTSVLHSEYRRIPFTVVPVDPALVVEGDLPLLTSAVLNLVLNAFKNTPSGGAVLLTTHADAGRLHIAVEDACGGIPEGKGDLFQPFAERRGSDRSGLGLGLSIARQAVRAHGGDIHLHNMPGKGCVFTIELPLLAADANAPPPSGAPVESAGLTREG